MNAVAGDVLASANAINYGGTKELSDWELHEQMEDGEGELDATTIAHIAIGWATNILSPQTGNSCALKSKPKILVPQVQLTHGVKKQPAPDNARSKHIFGTCTTCTTDCTTEQNHRLQTDCEHDDDKTASEVKQDAKVISPANGEITESAVFDITHRDKNKILSWLLKHVVSDDIAPDGTDPTPNESRSMIPAPSPRPSSSQRAWKAPSVQQATDGTPCPDQRPLSSAELAEASAFCLPAEQLTKGLGADSQSKAEQRPLASVELSEAASVTYTDGTPSKPGRIQRPLTSHG